MIENGEDKDENDVLLKMANHFHFLRKYLQVQLLFKTQSPQRTNCFKMMEQLKTSLKN